MKKKSLLRMGAVLLSYGFMINAMNVNTGMVVMAEEFSADEDTEPEDTTDQDIAGLTDGEENTEDTEDTAYGNAENQNVEETQDFQDIIDAEGNTENTIEEHCTSAKKCSYAIFRFFTRSGTGEYFFIEFLQ